MSERVNQGFQTLDQLRDCLSGSHLTYKGELVSQPDALTYSEAIVMWFLVCQDLSLPHVTEEWLHQVVSLDLYDVFYSLKKADGFLLDLTRDQSEQSISWTEFIQQPIISRVASILFRPIHDSMVSLSSQLDCVSVFSCIHQYLCFLSRLRLSIPTNDALNEYIDNDEICLSAPPPLASELNVILREWLQGFVVDQLPHHGSGATSDGMLDGRNGNHSLYAKYLALETDAILEYVVRREAIGWGMEDVLLPDSKRNLRKINRTTHWCAVPKTALGPRIISEEPTTLMFFQQAVNESLKRFIAGSDLHRHIPLENQEVNRNLAREGSITGQYVTVDLSHASDSVSWAVVKECFKGTPLLPWLYATRSLECATPYGPLLLRKFANMGSALTFTVECLIFAAVCQYCMQIHSLAHSRIYRWSVYGDDIICPTKVYSSVRECLGILGFVVNESKTFGSKTPWCFRESCGGEYLDGRDITPLRISRKYSGGGLNPLSPDRVFSLVQLANRSLSWGFLSLRSWVIHNLLLLPAYLQPAFGDNDNRLHSRMPGSFLSKRKVRKWEDVKNHRNIPYHCCSQYKACISHRKQLSDSHLGVRSDSSDSLMFEEEIRLHHWFLSRSRLDRKKENLEYNSALVHLGHGAIRSQFVLRPEERSYVGVLGSPKLKSVWVDVIG